MPVSRPLLIALGAAMLALVAFVASSSMRGGEEEASSPPPAPAKAPAAPQAAKPDVAKSEPAAKAASAERNVARPTTARADAGVPAEVQRAFRRGRTVVLFFYQRGGADDGATARSVASLRGRKGIAVFKAPVSRLGDFRAVTGKLGISQAPAVVIVGRKGSDGNARVVEGFVDRETLAQEVADSR